MENCAGVDELAIDVPAAVEPLAVAEPLPAGKRPVGRRKVAIPLAKEPALEVESVSTFDLEISTKAFFFGSNRSKRMVFPLVTDVAPAVAIGVAIGVRIAVKVSLCPK